MCRIEYDCSLPVCVTTIIHRKHENNLLSLIDHEEYAKLANAVAPYGGIVSLEFFDIGAKKGVLAELGVDILSQFLLDESRNSGRHIDEFLLKLVGLEYPKLRQSVHVLTWHP